MGNKLVQIIIILVFSGAIFLTYLFTARYLSAPTLKLLRNQHETNIYVLNRARTVEMRREAFQHEIILLEQRVKNYRELLPVSLEPVEFIRFLEGWIEERKGKVLSLRYEKRGEDILDTATMDMFILADKQSTKLLLKDQSALLRLIRWDSNEVTTSGLHWRLSIFAHPEEFDAPMDLCQEVHQEDGLWPWSVDIRELKKKIAIQCEEIHGYGDEIEMVDTLDHMRQSIARMDQIIRSVNQQETVTARPAETPENGK